MDLIEQIQSGNDDVLSQLPPELLFDMAIRFLQPKDILRLCRVSRIFNHTLCQNELFWKVAYQRDLSKYRVPRPRNTYKRAYLEIIEYLQSYPQNLLIYYAAGHGYEQLLQHLFDRGDTDYNAALTAAAWKGHRDIVNHMLDLGANNYNGALAAAAEGGHHDIVNQMLALGADDYTWALAMAAKGGHWVIMSQMMALGATDYNRAMIEAARGGHLDIVQQLINLGATDYELAARAASLEGHYEIADFFDDLIHAEMDNE